MNRNQRYPARPTSVRVDENIAPSKRAERERQRQRSQHAPTPPHGSTSSSDTRPTKHAASAAAPAPSPVRPTAAFGDVFAVSASPVDAAAPAPVGVATAGTTVCPLGIDQAPLAAGVGAGAPVV